MARRSRKTLQAEGQLSLFAMTDDFLFAVTENTENAVDKAAESRSYVNQIAGEAPADASRKGDEISSRSRWRTATGSASSRRAA